MGDRWGTQCGSAFSWGCVQAAPPTQPPGSLADKCLTFWTRRPGFAHQIGHSSTVRGFDHDFWPWRRGK